MRCSTKSNGSATTRRATTHGSQSTTCTPHFNTQNLPNAASLTPLRSESAQEILNDYHDNIGGIPEYEAPSSQKKGPKAGSKRSSAVAKLDSPQVTNSSKKTKRKSTNNTAAGAADVTNGDDAEHNPTNLPDGTWDHLVRVSSILEEPAVAVKGAKAKGGTILLALLIWDGSGRKTQHPLDVARRKCPQKLLDYYERHL